MTKNRIGALLFLAVSVGYGLMINQIPLLPGDELEPFTTRTLPTALAALGIGCSLLLLVLPSDEEEKNGVVVALKGLDWSTTGLLLLLMALYGVSIDGLGFLLATCLFLIAGFRILGERRLKVMLLVAIPFVLLFWLLLTQVLGIYLATGSLFAQ